MTVNKNDIGTTSHRPPPPPPPKHSYEKACVLAKGNTRLKFLNTRLLMGGRESSLNNQTGQNT